MWYDLGMKEILSEKILQQNIEDIPDVSWRATINGEEIVVTLKEVLEFLKDEPVVNLNPTDLEHLALHKDKEDEETLARIEKADLKYPIIIIVDSEQNYHSILDGAHRLQKALNKKVSSIQGKLLRFDSAPEKYRKLFFW